MKLRPLLAALATAQTEYHEKAPKLNSEQIAAETEKFKKLRAEVNEALTDGAKECPDCGNMPVGMFHDGTPKPFQLGCPPCGNKRVRGVLPEDVVEDWNAGNYLPPRQPGTAIARHLDATGAVKSERVVRVQRK